eukprot:TRINITY_DN3063_c0_g3_i1.p1 TRINITY_DN3063_c0_g3~~TRINITY_DN3063_c0_g3_i1.p1  ORF type:complete len:118 (-),score=21.07 TRINITY_DN3063_c0_g3_i1:24-377(-)
MVTSVQLEADLVGDNTESGAFVYGALSFTDKLSNGIAIYVIQKINGDSMRYARQALVYVPAAAAVVALLMIWVLDFESLLYTEVENVPESSPLQTCDKNKSKQQLNQPLLDDESRSV